MIDEMMATHDCRPPENLVWAYIYISMWHPSDVTGTQMSSVASLTQSVLPQSCTCESISYFNSIMMLKSGWCYDFTNDDMTTRSQGDLSELQKPYMRKRNVAPFHLQVDKCRNEMKDRLCWSFIPLLVSCRLSMENSLFTDGQLFLCGVIVVLFLRWQRQLVTLVTVVDKFRGFVNAVY